MTKMTLTGDSCQIKASVTRATQGLSAFCKKNAGLNISNYKLLFDCCSVINSFCVSQGDPSVMDEQDLLEQQKRVRQYR